MEVTMLILNGMILVVFEFVLFFLVLGKVKIIMIVELMNKKQIMANVKCVRITHTECRAYSNMVTIL